MLDCSVEVLEQIKKFWSGSAPPSQKPKHLNSGPDLIQFIQVSIEEENIFHQDNCITIYSEIFEIFEFKNY